MRLAAATTILVDGAALASAAGVGANDDSAKHAPDGGVAMYEKMRALGLEQVVIGVRFKPSEAIVVQDKQQLDRAIPNALDAGLRVAVYPFPPREVKAGLGSPSLFGSYVGALASIYPQVRQFVIGNEPNQPVFWQPQFDAGVRTRPRRPSALPRLRVRLAEGRRPGARRRRRRPLAPRQRSADREGEHLDVPVRFLRALGDWYRTSGRTRPLMDGFSFHPYPRRDTDPLDRGYSWPNAGFVNLDRLKQALWDAFHDTPQPTTLEGLKLYLDDGWQVARRAARATWGGRTSP